MAGAALAGIALLAAASTAMAGPTVIRSGRMVLKQTFVADFDTGATGAKGGVWFEAVNWSQMDLHPQDGAQIGSAMYTNAQGAAPFGYPFCSHANYGTATQPVTPAIAGAYFCVKTAGGHTAEFKVVRIAGDAAHHVPLVLYLSYTLWQ